MFLIPTLNCLSESRMSRLSRIWLDMPLTKKSTKSPGHSGSGKFNSFATPKGSPKAPARDLSLGSWECQEPCHRIPKKGSGWRIARIAVNFFWGYTATRFETLHGRSAETFDRLTLFIVCWGIWCRMRYGITALRRYHTFKHLIWCQGILVKANFVPKRYKRATWIDSILTNSLY